MAVHQNSHKSLFDDVLYCEEEKWGDVEDDEEESGGVVTFNHHDRNPSLFPLLLLEQDLFWDDEELHSLFCKEKQTTCLKPNNAVKETSFSFSLSLSRKEAVDWILKINAHYGFSALTAILAVNYLDRFLSSLSFQKDKPWMMQLAAVTCLSLAAKVEETHVPLLLDLQVEGTKYVFEAKTIQRMEVLVLSALKWRMNPVTPLSFLDHIIRRLGLKSYVHWEFLRNCENLLLSVISDSRFTLYLPSVMATATMLHVIHQVEPTNAIHYENQLLAVLKISKGEVDDCYEVISDMLANSNPLKRKIWQVESSSSRPDGIINKKFYSSDSSNESSWGVGSCVCSSPHQAIFKKRRVQEQQMRLPSLSRVFVDAVTGSSPH
ncbi:UNVERIFIED_CONTAM: Cyclin-D3-2 [Sesamum radiatum]|uniref:Cyclin-D3-2 n=1 Tax=Sesamum radiatum TaxID=300843 RepID=A0AAW2RVY1_SESRA